MSGRGGAVFRRAPIFLSLFFLAAAYLLTHKCEYLCGVKRVVMRRIELLAPAKDLEAAVAAIDHGADAVYMGGARFGARRAAANSVEDVARAAEYAHRYGARLYAALNTVIFEDELAAAESAARELIAADVDALIVQDMALRQMNLPVELHASTQAGCMTEEDAAFLEGCGFARIILERALTLDDIRRIRRATHAVDLECFVHGAICVGYSGRCFLSRSMSPRSGNRGECSQACRLPYDLTDEARRTIIAGKHLLSVRDMDLSPDLEALMDAGVTSFKIEGRLKDLRYIKNVVSYYRDRLDEILSRRWADYIRSSCGRTVREFEPDPSKSFTRGATEYMLHGKRRGVASFDTPKAVGEYVGRVTGIVRGGFRMDGAVPLAAGDGICTVSASGAAGTNVNRVDGPLVYPNRMSGIKVGTEIYRNYDHRFSLALDRSRTRRTIGVYARVAMSVGGIGLRLLDEQGTEVRLWHSAELSDATGSVDMVETVRRVMGKCGDTIFRMDQVLVDGAYIFAPASLLAEVRREGLEALLKAREALPREHRIMADDCTARYPRERVSRYENVTNSMAAEFYRRHGAREIEPALECARSTVGQRVMESSYCIRREIGECLRERPTLHGDLYLRHGASRYRLEFDCRRCVMSLVDCSAQRK